MSTEIKFRVWTGEEMITPPVVAIGSGSSAEIIEIALDGRVSKRNYYGLDSFAATNPAFDHPLKWGLMQFTGLKDQNGKDIYEGDIVRDSEMQYEVYFGELSLDEYEGIGWILKDIPENDEDNFWLAPSDASVLEVIGNIHENPDLLTPSTD